MLDPQSSQTKDQTLVFAGFPLSTSFQSKLSWAIVRILCLPVELFVIPLNSFGILYCLIEFHQPMLAIEYDLFV
jgi:hypothetical protein